jgi:hypothetical protein
MRPLRSFVVVAATTSLLAACADRDPSTLVAPKNAPTSLSLSVAADEDVAFSPFLEQLDLAQKVSGGMRNISLADAQISVKAGVEGWEGTTTLVSNRTHRFGSEFVARDPRRGGGADITYLIDRSDAVALNFVPPATVTVIPASVIEPEIDASMRRWQDQPACGGVAVTKVVDPGTDPDLIDGLVFADPARIGTPFADITHAGWLPASFFNAIEPHGANFILGVTFTFIFTDDDHNPTDIDHDGRADVAFREIYYNRAFPWTTNALDNNNIDIQSVVTHESGHAFGLAHFGKIMQDKDGFLKYAPRAVMTAAYVSAFRDLTGTDNSSYCQIWSSAR